MVINKCYGGFGLSPFGVKKFSELEGIDIYPFTIDESENSKLNFQESKQISWKEIFNNPKKYFLIHYSTKPILNGKHESESYFSDGDISRNNKNLIKIVEKYGKKVNGIYANLQIIEIPDNIKWEIEEYDGLECVSEEHRTWY